LTDSPTLGLSIDPAGKRTVDLEHSLALSERADGSIGRSQARLDPLTIRRIERFGLP